MSIFRDVTFRLMSTGQDFNRWPASDTSMNVSIYRCVLISLLSFLTLNYIYLSLISFRSFARDSDCRAISKKSSNKISNEQTYFSQRQARMMMILAGGTLLMILDLACLIGGIREDTFASDALQQTMGTVLRDRKQLRSDMYVPK